MVVAGLVPVMGSLTALDARWNAFESEGKAALMKAVKEREGVNLQL